jgi:hypothetical protein
MIGHMMDDVVTQSVLSVVGAHFADDTSRPAWSDI